MVEEPELVCDRGKGSSEVMGIPEEDPVEVSKDIRTEVMRASSEEAHLRFELLDGLIADGNSAFGNMEAEEVKPFDKGNNLCFNRGKGKTQLDAQERVHESQSLFSLGVRAAQDHEIIGIAHEAEAGLCQALVEAVKSDVRQKRRNNAALRSAGSGGAKVQPHHHASGEKLTDDAQDVAVSDALGDAIEDEVMGDVVEESLDVGVHDPFETGGMSRTESLNRLVSVTVRTEAKRELREVRLEDGFKKRTNHLLSDAVSDRGNAQRTKFAIPFWDVDPAQGSGAVVVFVLEVEQQGSEIVVQIGFKSANTDFVHPGSATIAFDSQKSATHAVEVDQPGKGVGFRQLDGQKTFLSAWRCCEAAEQNRCDILDPPGVFSKSSGCPNKPGGRERGRHPRRKHTLMERVTAFARNPERFTANRYSPSSATDYYGCADYPKLTDPKAGLVRPQHGGRISNIL